MEIKEEERVVWWKAKVGQRKGRTGNKTALRGER